MTGSPDSIEENRRRLEQARQEGNKNHETFFLSQLVNQTEFSNPNQSINYSHQLAEISRSQGNNEVAALHYRRAATTAERAGDLNTALDNAQRAWATAQSSELTHELQGHVEDLRKRTGRG